MDFNATVDLIIKDLNEVREIVDDFKNYPGIPALQVELAKSKCKSAAEVIALFKNLQAPVSISDTKEPVIIPEERKVKPEDKNTPPPNPEVKPLSPVNKKEKPDPTIKPPPESSIFADTFSHLPDSLNKRLGSLRDDDDVSGILKTKPVTNLSDAIGVNDKFLFIRELFNGNPESFDQAITRLDNAENLADANAIITTYTGSNKDTEAARQLFELVKRKFPADE